jgi:hypothetical protein
MLGLLLKMDFASGFMTLLRRLNYLLKPVDMWYVYARVSPLLSKYSDDDESIEDVADTEWAEENDVNWEETLDHCMS